ncbi:hypothetical protein ACCO45_012321 [Purpureocillium lilacinum]|uniref:Uncharacterized protein n=1 Tax=Purpureocillium lilacinum TaxID=33203 RepID=A0ACC4D8G2_PURLI
MARFCDEQWYCHCGHPATWLESKKEHNYGDKFARCPLNDGVGCKFFLWAKNEPLERATLLSKAAASSPTPRTPRTTGSSFKVESTPGTSSIERRPSQDADTRPGGRDGSPTPQGSSVRRQARAGWAPSNLHQDVLAILKAENVAVNESTRRKLLYAIECKVGVYEKLMRCFEDSVSELSNGMAQASINGSPRN